MPGCFFRIGTNTNNEKYLAPVHNAHFDIDEQALEIGMGMMAWIAINALRTK
jgi:metal-dependent amidase/aminoacylase/carboxypeptidase family protein